VPVKRFWVMGLAAGLVLAAAQPRAAMFELDLASEDGAKQPRPVRQDNAAFLLRKWSYLGPLYEKERRCRRMIDMAMNRLSEARENEPRAWYDFLRKREESLEVRAAERLVDEYQRKLIEVRVQIDEYYREEEAAAR
jgi:hypothetical protein